MSSGPGRRPRVSDEEILKLFRESDDPVLSTAEVADELPIKRRGTLDRLNALVDEDKLRSKPIGGRNKVWWIAEDDTADSGSSTSASETEEAPEFEPPRETEPEPEPVHDPLADVEFPNSQDQEDCIEAVNAAHDFLKDRERATMREFVTEVMPEHSLGYSVPELESGERYRGAWWRTILKPSLKAFPDVEKPKPGQSEWKYVGE